MILDLRTPRVVTARSLAHAISRELDRRHGSRRDFALAHSMTQSEVSRATARGDRYGDSAPLRRVAATQGYELHPSMPGHYRRMEPAPTPTAPEPDDDVDDELEQLARDLAAESEDADTAPDPMFADLVADAAHERFLEQMAADDAAWRREVELSWTPDDLQYFAEMERETAA